MSGSPPLRMAQTSSTDDAELLLNVSRAVVLSPTNRPRTMHGAHGQTAQGRETHHLRANSESSLAPRSLPSAICQNAGPNGVLQPEYGAEDGYGSMADGLGSQAEGPIEQQYDSIHGNEHAVLPHVNGHGETGSPTFRPSRTPGEGNAAFAFEGSASVVGAVSGREDALSADLALRGERRSDFLQNGFQHTKGSWEETPFDERAQNSMASSFIAPNGVEPGAPPDSTHDATGQAPGIPDERANVLSAENDTFTSPPFSRPDRPSPTRRGQSAPPISTVFQKDLKDPALRPASATSKARPLDLAFERFTKDTRPSAKLPLHQDSSAAGQASGCAKCQVRSAAVMDYYDEEDSSWIRCDGCQCWFHFSCAGLTGNEVRTVDKFICESCRSTHGPTTCTFLTFAWL